MPYIPRLERIPLDQIIHLMGQYIPIDKPGYVAYVLFGWFRRYIKARWINFCIFAGTLLLTILEVYRRMGAPYEDERRAEHGDVQ